VLIVVHEHDFSMCNGMEKPNIHFNNAKSLPQQALSRPSLRKENGTLV
jgi:hypothetical protein